MRRLPLRRRVPLEIDGRPSVAQQVKRAESHVAGTAGAGRPKLGGGQRQRFKGCENVVADQRRGRGVVGRIDGAEIGGEHKRAVKKRNRVGIVRSRFDPECSRQTKLDAVALFPKAPDRQIAGVLFRDRRRFAVYERRRRLAPCRRAQRDVECLLRA